MQRDKKKLSTVLWAAIFLLLFLSFMAERVWASFNLEDEKKLGKEFYDKLEKHNALVKDPKISDYITRLGNDILSHSNKVPFDFKFSVIRSSAINAFATPGGYVYVNRGIIALAENEAELAGVLAHEIAHVNARHIASIIEKSQKINMAALAAIIAGAFLGGGGELSAATMAFSMAAATTLNLKYSREHEEDADRLGMLYLVNTGYDGQAMLDFLKQMRRYEFYSSMIPSYFLTHPGTDERIRYLDGLLQTIYRAKGKDDITGRFKRIQTLMIASNPDAQANLKHFEAALKKNANDADDLYGLALTQEKLGQTKQSLGNFLRALKLSPNDVDILRDTGITYFKSGQPGEAIPLLQKALKGDESDIQSRLYLGRAFGALEDYTSALEIYEKIDPRQVDDADIYYNMAIAYGKTNHPGDYHYYFGIYLKKTNKRENALYHLKAALSYVDRDSPRAQSIEKEIKELQKNKL